MQASSPLAQCGTTGDMQASATTHAATAASFPTTLPPLRPQLYSDPLLTVTPTSTDEASPSLSVAPHSLPTDVAARLLTALVADDGVVDGGDAGRHAQLSPELLLSHHSICSSDIDVLLRTITPRSSPALHDCGEGVETNDSCSKSRCTVRTPFLFGDSENSRGGDPLGSLPNTPGLRPDSDLLTPTTAALQSIVHSLPAVASPCHGGDDSSSHSSAYEGAAQTGDGAAAAAGGATPSRSGKEEVRGRSSDSCCSEVGEGSGGRGTATPSPLFIDQEAEIAGEADPLPSPSAALRSLPIKVPTSTPAAHSTAAAFAATATATRASSTPPPCGSMTGSHSAPAPHAASATVPSGQRASPRKAPSGIAAWLRSRVSQNKIRYRSGGFDLDLTYITPHIIAMGYPAHGTEHYIRNPIEEVERFLDERHSGHFRVYNLCSERAYDGPHRFHGCFRRFPFDDHNAPPLGLMLRFVRDAAGFLDADGANVVAVHCKAGKGRTGIMVSCLLYYLYPDKFATATEAMNFFDCQRTNDGAGMTIPSQRRYVGYFERVLRDFHGAVPSVQRRLALREVVVRVARENTLVHSGDLYFILSNHERGVLLDSRMWFPRGPTITAAGCIFSFASLSEVAVPLMGDVKFAFFRRRPLVLSGKESTACYLWLNTTLCPSLQMVFHRAELDKVDTAAVGKSVMIALSFTVVGETDEGKTVTSTQGAEGNNT